MTTAPHSATAPTGRPITPAASGAELPCASLPRAASDKAFYDSAQDHFRARIACRRCPVVADCLMDGMKSDDHDRVYGWGVFGGLTPKQRQALRVHLQLGDVPNLSVARVLARGRWSYRLRAMLEKGVRYEEMRVRLEREYRVTVSMVTLRVAVWWLGGRSSMVPRPARSDRRTLTRRLREDHAPLLLALQEAGVRQVDIAAYLEVSESSVKHSCDRLNREVREAAAAEAAAAEMVGLAA